MTFEYLADPGRGPKWTGLLPGAPEAYFLRRGEGEHSKLFTDLFTVLVSGDETGGRQVTRLLEPGDFGYVPARLTHAYRVEQAARMLGVLSGGFERFFQHMGTATDTAAADQPPFIPDLDRIQAAGRQHGTQFFPGYTWPNA